MKRFLVALLLCAFLISTPCFAVDKSVVLTFELYNSSQAYSTTGGVTTAASGTSDMTCTFNGTVATTLDRRTVNLDDYLGADSRTFIIQLGSSYVNDTRDKTYGGVTIARTAGGTWTGHSGVTAQVALAFSNYDTANAWLGVSKYWVYSKAMSGNSLWLASFQPSVTPRNEYSSGTSTFVSVNNPIGRYMRVYWMSGITAFRKAPVSVLIGK